MPYYVYILANKKNGTLYIGVTNDLVRRVHEHRNHVADGFTKKYEVDRLVYFESFDYGQAALQRERTMKQWRRDWKIALIERENPIGAISSNPSPADKWMRGSSPRITH